jgi:DNA-binding transcriptional LysR family regulator
MKLEEELGTKLFVRTKRNVQLTESGNTLVHYANKILDLTELAKAEVGEIAAGSKGLLSLGYVGPAMDGFLPKIINAFKLRYPGVELRLRQMTTSEQLSGIREGMVHAGIVRISGQDTKGLEAIPVHQETYLLAIPSYYPLAHNRSVSIGELADQPMIFYPRNSQPGLFKQWHDIFIQEGFFPNIVQESTSYHSSIALVESGLGVAIVPKSSARMQREGVAFLKLTGKKPKLVFHLCYLESSVNPVIYNFGRLFGEQE